MNHKTNLFENGMIWFGAGVSIAEILTGTYFASLGLKNALLTILIGHVIGCVLLFFAGYIGGIARKSAMETTKMSFGQKGGLFFALMNVIQLIGWTAIMIYDGSLSANAIWNTGAWVWALVIGLLIILWIKIGITNLGKINTVTMTALFILTLILCKVIFFGRDSITAVSDDTMTFGAAVELAVAMPLSWMPLISDYTKEAEKPFAATLTSSIVYGIISCWMYIIGMGAALFAGTTDISVIMVRAGLGIVGLLIVVFSTVTTTFLDAYSAGISAESLTSKVSGKTMAIIVAIIGTLCAMIFPMDDITNFLYFIGSVFAPMIAIMIADFLVKADDSDKDFQWVNLLVWLLGFCLYRYLMTVDFVLGNTFPDIIITMVVALIARKLIAEKK
ncbi:MAG: putative hydroxymethylpyrimidine transporter CytX [Eubacteriales bacterium]|nr:putative hydroxymethylpyrimidine transporter CytX [Eubacteriales bacterium]